MLPAKKQFYLIWNILPAQIQFFLVFALQVQAQKYNTSSEHQITTPIQNAKL